HLRSTTVGMTSHFQRAGRNTPAVTLNVNLSPTPDLQVEPFRKRVNDGNTNSVQSPGDFVRRVVKFAARVQFGQNDFRGRLSLFRHDLGRKAAAVINRSD